MRTSISCLAVALATGCGGSGASGGPGSSGAGPDLAPPAAAADLGGPAPAGGVDLAEPPVVHPVDGVTVATLAGSSVAGWRDGVGAAAELDNPTGVALGDDGTLYVTEYDGSRVRAIAADGTVTTLMANTGMAQPFAVLFAGTSLVVQTDSDASGVKDVATGTLWNLPLDGSAPTTLVSALGRPRGLALAASTELVVADHARQTLSLFDTTTTTMTLLAGTPGSIGLVNGTHPLFDEPIGVVVLSDGSVVVADSDNHCLRRVAPDGSATTFAGDGHAGMVDGNSAVARFDRPIALAVDGADTIYVSDQGANHRLRRVTAAGEVETLAGNGTAGFADGPGPSAAFYGQEGLAVTSDGATLYVADGNAGDGSGYHRVRVLTLP